MNLSLTSDEMDISASRPRACHADGARAHPARPRPTSCPRMRADADDYDYDDGLIDNSELEQKFNSRVIAKHKHKKQRTAGGGFRIDSNLDDDENEEEGDEDEDDDEEEGEEDEEMGEAEGGSRAKESGSGTAAKRSGHLQKRRRRRQWLRDGDNNFNEVLPVRSAIDEKLGPDGKRLNESGLNKENLQAIVDIFAIAERNHCAADKLLAWIAQKLDKTVQPIENRVRKEFLKYKAKHAEEQEMDKLHRHMDEAARSRHPLVVGNVDDARSFAGIIKSLIDAVRISYNTVKIQTALKDVFKEALRKIRLVRDATSREPLELHLLFEIVGCARDVLGKGAGDGGAPPLQTITYQGYSVSVPQHMTQFTDKLDQIRKSKLSPVEALPPRSSGGPGGAFVSPGAPAAGAAVARAPAENAARRPYKSNVFDSIPAK